MSSPSVITLRVPHALKSELVDFAKSQGVSLNQFIAYALTEKIKEYQAQDFFDRLIGDKTSEEILAGFDRVMKMNADRPPLPGDELPDMDDVSVQRKVAIAAN